MTERSTNQQDTANLMQPFVAMSKFGIYSTAAMTDVWLGAMRGFVGALEETGKETGLEANEKVAEEAAKGLAKDAGRAEKAVPKANAKPSPKAPVEKVAASNAEAETASEDDLKLITGIGPKLEKILKRKEITTFAQIAKLRAKQIKELDEKLSLSGRIERDKWIDQAKALIRNK